MYHANKTKYAIEIRRISDKFEQNFDGNFKAQHMDVGQKIVKMNHSMPTC